MSIATAGTGEEVDALAVRGGRPVRAKKMPVRKLFGAEERAAVLELFDRAIAEGSHVLGYNGAEEEGYCREFAEFLGGGYADAVNSGTNAVLVAVRALELEPYGEVIVPPITDPGGVMPVALANLVPVPADAEPGSFNTSAEQIEKRITDRTRAIMVAHVSGIPVDMDPVLELASRHGLPVIEDAAQAHGAKYKGRMVGSLGTISAFSTMFGKQHATGGQGGLVFTKDKDLYWRVRRHADRGKPYGISLEGKAGAGVGVAASQGGNVVAAGNHNMDELHACIGRVQLRRLPEFIRRRREFARRVAEGCRPLRCVEAVWLPAYADSENACEPSFWFLLFRFDAEACQVGKAEFVAALQAEGVPFDPTYLYIPPRQPWALNRCVFGKGASGLPWEGAGVSNQPPPLPNADEADATHFRLTIHEGLGDAEANDVVAALTKVDAAFAK